MKGKNKKEFFMPKEVIEKHYIYQEFKPYLDHCEEIERNYIEQRLIRQIIWYDKKAMKEQKLYKKLTICTIIFTATIPVISHFMNSQYTFIATLLISILSMTSTAILSIINLCEYRNLWIEYRANCEMLKSNLHKYFTRSAEFNPNERTALDLLVASSEQYMTKEFDTWAGLTHRSGDIE